jgi:hypothetical protein
VGGSITFEDFISLDSTEDFINGDISMRVCPNLNKNETYISLKFRKIYVFQQYPCTYSCNFCLVYFFAQLQIIYKKKNKSWSLVINTYGLSDCFFNSKAINFG